MAALVWDIIIIGCSPISCPGISPPIGPRIDGLGCGEVPGAFCACAIDPANATAAPMSKNFRICFISFDLVQRTAPDWLPSRV
jgi:hypothetical protein